MIRAPAPQAPRWKRRKEARPSELVSAALDLFVEQGFAATKIDDIARRAGVSKGTVYLYFESKEALLAAVVQESTGSVFARALELLAEVERGAAELIRELTWMWVRSFVTRQVTGLPKLIYCEAGSFPGIAQAYLEQADRARRVFEELIERGIAAGEFAPQDVPATARAYIGGIIFQMIYRHSLAAFEGGAYDFERCVAAHIELALSGMAARG